MTGNRRVLREAGPKIARSHDTSVIASVSEDVLSGICRHRDTFVMNRLDLESGRYTVLAGSTGGPAGYEEAIADHGVLGALEDLEKPVILRQGDPRVRPELRLRMEAAKVRRVIHLPAVDGAGVVRAAVIVLSRSIRPAYRSRRVRMFLRLLGDALQRAGAREALEMAHDRERRAVEAFDILVESMRTIDAAASSEEVLGDVLRRIQQLDQHLIGAVVGLVSERVVVRVAAVGATPRSAVEATKGTRIDGFPIGRQLLDEHQAIFATLDEVSHATRTRIMDPLDAQSLLAAGGRSRDELALVLSAYRADPARPPAWTMAAIRSVLDHAATNLERLKQDARFAAVAGVVDEAVVMLDRTSHVLYASPRLQPLLGDGCPTEGARFPAGAYERLDGSPVEPHDLTPETQTRMVLRERTTGAMHEIRSAPIASGGHVLSICAVDEAAVGGEILDLGERRARKTP